MAYWLPFVNLLMTYFKYAVRTVEVGRFSSGWKILYSLQ